MNQTHRPAVNNHPDQTPALARQIIAHLGQSGTPPEEGVEWYTVGLDEYLDVLREEYLETLIPDGISSFKLVIGSYGGGKTHFLYCVRNLAERLGFVVTYIPLSPVECPFNQMDAVYRALMANLRFPLRAAGLDHEPVYNRGIEAFLRYFVHQLTQRMNLSMPIAESEIPRLREYFQRFVGLESTSFRRAMEEAAVALARDDEDRFHQVVQWLKGEKIQSEVLRSAQIVETIDQRSAFRMIRSLAQWVREAGYPGLVVLFDEAERAISLGVSRQVMAALDNLRQWIDECGQGRFPGVLTLYAVPDEMMLIDRPGPSYEALRQRLQTIFSRWEPTGVKIYLERIRIDAQTFLLQLGQRLLAIYQRAYDVALPPELAETNIRVLAARVYQTRYADISYRRLFITNLIPLLHRMRQDPSFVLTDAMAEQWIVQRLSAMESVAESYSEGHEY